MSMYDAAEKALNDWAFETMLKIERRFGECDIPLAVILTAATVLLPLLAGRH